MQLVIQHIMFGPDWDAPCPTCANFMNQLPPGPDRLHDYHTAYALVSRAPLAKIKAYQASQGWSLPWYSSYGSDFNYDFQVSLDEAAGQLMNYNYQPAPGMLGTGRSTELPGVSCFLRDGGEVFHTYSAYARGLDHTDLPYAFLDLTVLGRRNPGRNPRPAPRAARRLAGPPLTPTAPAASMLSRADGADGARPAIRCTTTGRLRRLVHAGAAVRPVRDRNPMARGRGVARPAPTRCGAGGGQRER